jgi:methyl-accepting chemotaxis protein
MAATAAEKDRQEESVNESLRLFDKTWRLYEPTVTTPAEQALVAAFKKAWGAYLDGSKEMMELARRNSNQAKELYLGRLHDDFGLVRKALEQDLAFNVEEGKKEADKGAEVYRSGRLWIFVTLVLAALLCAGFHHHYRRFAPDHRDDGNHAPISPR